MIPRHRMPPIVRSEQRAQAVREQARQKPVKDLPARPGSPTLLPQLGAGEQQLASRATTSRGGFTQSACERCVSEALAHKRIDKGTFGKIYPGTLVSPDGSLQAVVVKSARPKGEKSLFQEYWIHACVRLQHPGIVRYLGAVKPADGAVQLIFERLDDTLRGRLLSLDAGGEYPVTRRYQHAGQLLEALAYLSRKRLAHGDISSRNIMFDAQDTLKLIDFGSARRQRPVNPHACAPLPAPQITTHCGSPPELFFRQGLACPASDCFSAGFVLVRLLTASLDMRKWCIDSRDRCMPLEYQMQLDGTQRYYYPGFEQPDHRKVLIQLARLPRNQFLHLVRPLVVLSEQSEVYGWCGQERQFSQLTKLAYRMMAAYPERRPTAGQCLAFYRSEARSGERAGATSGR